MESVLVPIAFLFDDMNPPSKKRVALEFVQNVFRILSFFSIKETTVASVIERNSWV